jgi:hypothetical protein
MIELIDKRLYVTLLAVIATVFLAYVVLVILFGILGRLIFF